MAATHARDPSPSAGAARGPLAELRDRRLWAVALSFGAISMMWTTYNAYVPGLLGGLFGVPAFLVGLILLTDNLLGFFLEPITGMLSDRARAHVGQRLSWLLLCFPVAVLCFVLLPLPALLVPHALLNTPAALGPWLTPTTLFVIGMLVAMSLIRTPTLAIMPDLAASPERNLANGLVQTVGGVASLLALITGDWLVRSFSPAVPFWVAGAAMVGAGFFLWLTMRGREAPPVPEATAAPAEAAPRGHPLGRELLLVLGAVAGWWLGFACVNAFLGPTLSGRWGLDGGVGDLYAGGFGLAAAVAGIPAGLLANRWGRRPMLVGGTMLLIGTIAAIALLPLPFVVALFLTLVAGVSWAGTLVGALPMLLDLGHPARPGLYTGLYYLAFALAGIVGPQFTAGLAPLGGAGGLIAALFPWGLALLALGVLPPGAGEPQPAPDPHHPEHEGGLLGSPVGPTM